MSTVAEILAAAHARSAQSEPADITASADMVAALGRILRRYFLLAAREVPTFFGEQADVALSTVGGVAGWTRPAAALVVFRVESVSASASGTAIAAGTKIEVVPINDRQLAGGDPAVYEMGRRYRSAGNAADPTAGTLRLYYSTAPTLPTDAADEIDSRWPTAHDDLLVITLAQHLAKKDGRADDEAALAPELSDALALFRETLREATTTTATRFVDFRPAAISPAGE